MDTDLATLRRRLQFKSDMAALARVEAELSRLRDGVRDLYCEVDCRVEHGAESGGHLDFVRRELRALLDTPADSQEDKKT